MRWDSFSKIFEAAAQWIFLFLVSVYRMALSPIFGGNCRFEPSCSIYAEQALKELPLTTALKLITRRVLSCRPGGAFGPDPVPKRECRHE